MEDLGRKSVTIYVLPPPGGIPSNRLEPADLNLPAASVDLTEQRVEVTILHLVLDQPVSNSG